MDTVSSGLYRHHCYSSLMKINHASFSHTINNCLEGVNLMGILPWSDSDVFKALNKAQGGLSYPQVPPPLNPLSFQSDEPETCTCNLHNRKQKLPGK